MIQSIVNHHRIDLGSVFYRRNDILENNEAKPKPIHYCVR